MVAAGVIKGNYNEIAAETGPSEDFSRRMGTRQAQMLATALERLDRQTDHRRWVAGQYRSRIVGAGVAHLPHDANVAPVFGRYPMLVEDKQQWVESARAARVELADFYATPVHPLEGDALRRVGYEPGSCPQAEWVSDRIVSLPTSLQTDRKQVQRAVDCFNR
jgi:dTDP-4-amino-4,6-dideoxygalactose transaminase